jgi:APA family basic amino acid/polyamine antiporter|tara:strand:- start:2642 stop:4030 length:1389 start_codon:yes stop_codon:yes gene_type:complete
MELKSIPKGHHHKKLKHSKKFTLKRNLGLLETTSCGVGIISGAGIYALIGVAAGMAGNSLWLALIVSAAVAVLSGLSYAELSSVFTSDAGEYSYADHAFGKKIAFFVGWLVLSATVISVTAIAIGFSGYFSALFGGPKLLIAFLMVGSIAFVNFIGIKESTKLNVVFTLIEVGGLIFIILIGLPHLFTGLTTNPGMYLEMPNGFQGLFSAAALIFFAFIGFESVVKLSEETKEPEKTIPKALILSIIITTILYILVALSAVSIMDWQVLGASTAPLADIAASVFGAKVFVILGIVALFSTFNTNLVSMLASSRIAYGMGGDHSLPYFLSHIHSKRKTPWKAIFTVALVSSILLLSNNIELVAEMTNLAIFLTFISVNVSLIYLRYKDPKMKRPFRVPGTIGKMPVIPIIGILLCLFMISNLGLLIILGGVILILFGWLFYRWFDLFKHTELRLKVKYHKRVK